MHFSRHVCGLNRIGMCSWALQISVWCPTGIGSHFLGSAQSYVVMGVCVVHPHHQALEMKEPLNNSIPTLEPMVGVSHTPAGAYLKVSLCQAQSYLKVSLKLSDAPLGS